MYRFSFAQESFLFERGKMYEIQNYKQLIVISYSSCSNIKKVFFFFYLVQNQFGAANASLDKAKATLICQAETKMAESHQDRLETKKLNLSKKLKQI